MDGAKFPATANRLDALFCPHRSVGTYVGFSPGGSHIKVGVISILNIIASFQWHHTQRKHHTINWQQSSQICTDQSRSTHNTTYLYFVPDGCPPFTQVINQVLCFGQVRAELAIDEQLVLPGDEAVGDGQARRPLVVAGLRQLMVEFLVNIIQLLKDQYAIHKWSLLANQHTQMYKDQLNSVQ